ncbi:MAG: glycosyltransferase family 2 protein [Methanobacteriaceae archaeon]|nr:glycosyltransferase family 2 protein [Methanobacteriaceae archaeon]
MDNEKMLDLSIIIVNYRTYYLTKQTIESVITKNHPFKYDIYLVDNASHDGSLEKLRNDFSNEVNGNLIKVIESEKNKGFAYANNLALKRTDSKYVLLINSDTVVIDDCLAKCHDYMKTHPSVGALGCKVILPDGTLDKACRRSFPDIKVSFYRMTGISKLFPQSERFGKYNLCYMDDDGTYPVDCLVGAFMMVKYETIQEVSLLDENFFMYGEDIDWCYRIKEAGWQIMYLGSAKIIHYKGSSSQKQKSRLIYEFHRAMYIFYNNHYKQENSIITTLFTYIGIGLIFGLKLILNLLKK